MVPAAGSQSLGDQDRDRPRSWRRHRHKPGQ